MRRFGRGLGIVGELLGENHWANQKNVVYGIVMYPVLFFLCECYIFRSKALAIRCAHARTSGMNCSPQRFERDD